MAGWDPVTDPGEKGSQAVQCCFSFSSGRETYGKWCCCKWMHHSCNLYYSCNRVHIHSIWIRRLIIDDGVADLYCGVFRWLRLGRGCCLWSVMVNDVPESEKAPQQQQFPEQWDQYQEQSKALSLFTPFLCCFGQSLMPSCVFQCS